MALRSLTKWSIGAVLLVAVGCGGGVPGAADDPVDPSAFTLALCESALERRLAIENDQARVVDNVPLSWHIAFNSEWRRLGRQRAEAGRDINTYCLEAAKLATPTPTPTATPTLEPRPTATPIPRRRSIVPTGGE